MRQITQRLWFGLGPGLFVSLFLVQVASIQVASIQVANAFDFRPFLEQPLKLTRLDKDEQALSEHVELFTKVYEDHNILVFEAAHAFKRWRSAMCITLSAKTGELVYKDGEALCERRFTLGVLLPFYTNLTTGFPTNLTEGEQAQLAKAIIDSGNLPNGQMEDALVSQTKFEKQGAYGLQFRTRLRNLTRRGKVRKMRFALAPLDSPPMVWNFGKARKTDIRISAYVSLQQTDQIDPGYRREVVQIKVGRSRGTGFFYRHRNFIMTNYHLFAKQHHCLQTRRCKVRLTQTYLNSETGREDYRHQARQIKIIDYDEEADLLLFRYRGDLTRGEHKGKHAFEAPIILDIETEQMPEDIFSIGHMSKQRKLLISQGKIISLANNKGASRAEDFVLTTSLYGRPGLSGSPVIAAASAGASAGKIIGVVKGTRRRFKNPGTLPLPLFEGYPVHPGTVIPLYLHDARFARHVAKFNTGKK